MNVRFNHRDKYRYLRPLDPRWVESDQAIGPTYIEQDLENMFFNNNFAERTGLSYLEARQLDLPTYRRLCDRTLEYNKERSKQFEAMSKGSKVSREFSTT